MQGDNFEKRQKDDVIFINQRSNPRISAEIEVSLTGPHNFFNGFTEDISKGGLFIATTQLFPIGTEFNVSLTIEGREILIVARVMWQREVSPFLPAGVEPGMGLKFIDIKPEEIKLIEQFLKKKEPIFFDADL